MKPHYLRKFSFSFFSLHKASRQCCRLTPPLEGAFSSYWTGPLFFTRLLILEATAKPVTTQTTQTERTHLLLSTQKSPSRMSSWSECVCLSHSQDITSGQVMCLWTGRYINAQTGSGLQTDFLLVSVLSRVRISSYSKHTHPSTVGLAQRRGWQASKLAHSVVRGRGDFTYYRREFKSKIII